MSFVVDLYLSLGYQHLRVGGYFCGEAHSGAERKSLVSPTYA